MPRATRALSLVAAGSAVLAVAAGYAWYRYQAGEARERALAEVAVMAEFKADQIASWLNERRNDASLLAGNPRFGADLVEIAAAPRPPRTGPLIRFLGSLERVYHYRSAFVLDATGRVVLTIGAAPDAASVPEELLRRAMETGEVVTGQLRPVGTGGGAPAFLDIVAPLVSALGAPPVGVAVLRIDAAGSLFPLVQRWPGGRESAEFVLARRENGDVVRLNPPRRVEGASRAVRVPLADRGRALVQAALGPGAAVEGLDYRGNRVLGASRAIEPMNWVLLAQIDETEIMAPLRTAGLYVGAFVFVLFAGTGGLFAMRSAHQREAYEQRLRLERLEHEALARHFDYGIRYARDIVLLLDESLRVRECNDAALAAYGYTREEMLGLELSELRAAEARGAIASDYSSRDHPDGHLFETVHQRKDRSTFPVEVGARLIEIEGRRFYQAVVRDISERRAAQGALEREARRYKALMDSAIDGIHVLDRNGCLVEANPAFLAMLGYERDELLGHHAGDWDAHSSRAQLQQRFDAYRPGASRRFETRHRRKDSSILDVELSAITIDLAGERYHWGAVRDITERKAAERRVERLTRLYATLSRANEAIVRARSEETLFADLCRVAVDHGRMHGALVRIADAEAKLLRPAAYYGSMGEAGARVVASIDPERPEFATLSSLAFRENRIVVENDLRPDKAPWDRAVYAAGVRAIAVLPLRRGDEPVGVLVLNANEAGFFDPETRSLLEDLVTDVAYVLDNLEYERRRKAAEGKVERLSRMYATLAATNEAVVRSRSEDDLFASLCRIAVEHGRMLGALVRMVDDETKRLRPVAYSDALKSLIDDIPVVAEPGAPKREELIRMGYTENRIVIDNDRTSRLLEPEWQDRLRTVGIRAVAVLPVRRAGKAVGTVTLNSAQPGFFDPETVGLLEQMVADIAFAMDNFEAERRRTRAEREVRESEERFRGLVEQSIAGISIVQDGITTYMNKRCAEIFGYAPEELIGRPATMVIAEEDRERVTQDLRTRLVGEKRSIQYTFTGLRKDGSTITVGVHRSLATFGGRPATIGLLQDISERERAQQQIQSYVQQLEHSMLGTLAAVSAIAEMRDPYTAGHEKRVGALARRIGEEMGLSENVCRGLEITGGVHDIGKVSIPSEILSKPGKLSKMEFEIIKVHPRTGYDVLKEIDFPWPVAQATLQHHERVDGSGYPQGFKGEEIILEARILAVADVVEAMGSHRPYRPTLGIDAALAEVEKYRGVHYDAEVVDACLRLFREKGYRLPGQNNHPGA